MTATQIDLTLRARDIADLIAMGLYDEAIRGLEKLIPMVAKSAKEDQKPIEMNA